MICLHCCPLMARKALQLIIQLYLHFKTHDQSVPLLLCMPLPHLSWYPLPAAVLHSATLPSTLFQAPGSTPAATAAMSCVLPCTVESHRFSTYSSAVLQRIKLQSVQPHGRSLQAAANGAAWCRDVQGQLSAAVGWLLQSRHSRPTDQAHASGIRPASCSAISPALPAGAAPPPPAAMSTSLPAGDASASAPVISMAPAPETPS